LPDDWRTVTIIHIGIIHIASRRLRLAMRRENLADLAAAT